MTSTVRRAGAFALVGTVALAAPALGAAAAIPFVVVALLAAFVVDDGRMFELFARPSDYREERLYGLAGFCLAAAGLALLTTVLQLPIRVFVAAVLLVAYGNLAEQWVRETDPRPIAATTAFAVGGFLAAALGQLVVVWTIGRGGVALPEVAFLAASGALLGSLLRSVLFERDDPLVMLSIGLLLWLFTHLMLEVSAAQVLVAVAITVALGYLAWALETASIPGMLTGMFLALLTIILGGYGWFAVMISFFAIGGLSTKFRYEDKRKRGVAEANEGARGSGNVLGNAAVALFAVLGFAASPLLPVNETVFLFAFAGSIAAAMSDTLSSEIGGVFDQPRLITTLEPVPPGTDGGITWQGEVAGVAGAALVGVIAVALFPGLEPRGAAIIVIAGIGGMTVDSLLGATLEGDVLGNQSVNFFATLAGALLSALLFVLGRVTVVP